MPLRSLAALTLLVAASIPVHADILFSVGGPGDTTTTVAQGPNQFLPIFLRSDASDTINGLAFDFLFPEMIDIDTGSSTFATGAGTNPGFFADGNIQSAQLTATEVMGADTNLNVNYELTDPELIPSTFTNFFTLAVDTSDLPVGTYTIDYDPNSTGAFLVDDTGFAFVPVATSTLSFNVVAIPEPGSLALAAVGSTVCLVRRRRRR